jgi:hypothetical protein
MVIEHHVPDVPDRQVQPTDGGILWHAVTKRDNGHFRETAGQGRESPAKKKRPQQDSNLRSRLRREQEFGCGSFEVS